MQAALTGNTTAALQSRVDRPVLQASLHEQLAQMDLDGADSGVAPDLATHAYLHGISDRAELHAALRPLPPAPTHHPAAGGSLRRTCPNRAGIPDICAGRMAQPPGHIGGAFLGGQPEQIRRLEQPFESRGGDLATQSCDQRRLIGRIGYLAPPARQGSKYHPATGTMLAGIR